MANSSEAGQGAAGKPVRMTTGDEAFILNALPVQKLMFILISLMAMSGRAHDQERTASFFVPAWHEIFHVYR